MENLSRYLEDKRFIQWVFHPNEELEAWWDAYMTENDRERQKILLARRILQKLKTHDRHLSDTEKVDLFAGILRQVEENRRTDKVRRLTVVFLRYAAVALIFFALGALLFYQKNHFNPGFIARDFPEPVHADEAQLIRPDGENILLSERNSRIEYLPDGQVVVNNSRLETVKPKGNAAPMMNQLVIPYGKTSEIILPDGTAVFLNAGSRLVYPEYFDEKTREVFLVGEAFFEVEHDKNKPFVVQTTDIRIRVLGTRFNISAYASDNIIETVLTEGKVRIEPNSSGFFAETTDILPGQLAAYSKIDRITQLREVETENYTLWKEGLIRFESTDLSRVVKRLERYYNIRFKYQDPFLGSIKISGKLELGDSRDVVFENVATAASVQIRKINDGFYEISQQR